MSAHVLLNLFKGFENFIFTFFVAGVNTLGVERYLVIGTSE